MERKTAKEITRAHSTRKDFNIITKKDVPEMKAGILKVLTDNSDGLSDKELWDLCEELRSIWKRLFSRSANDTFRRALSWAIAKEELLLEKRIKVLKGSYYPK